MLHTLLLSLKLNGSEILTLLHCFNTFSFYLSGKKKKTPNHNSIREILFSKCAETTKGSALRIFVFKLGFGPPAVSALLHSVHSAVYEGFGGI